MSASFNRASAWIILTILLFMFLLFNLFYLYLLIYDTATVYILILILKTIWFSDKLCLEFERTSNWETEGAEQELVEQELRIIRAAETIELERNGVRQLRRTGEQASFVRMSMTAHVRHVSVPFKVAARPRYSFPARSSMPHCRVSPVASARSPG